MSFSILVTGGAGFIGSHLAVALLQAGYQVTVLDNLAYGERQAIPSKATFIEGNICDLATCRRAVKNVSVVFHCAAMSRAHPSLAETETCTHTNIIGTQNILIASRDAQVKKVIYSGSSTYYGNQPVPHKEYATPSHFLNTYALSKAVGEQYCLLFNEVFQLPCLILRYFNVYGPRQPQNGSYALVIGTFLKAWANNQALCVHGTGEQRRDFIHVEDVVAANLAALRSSHQHDIFNVGSGTNLSIKELADMISAKQSYGPARTADAATTLADLSHIQASLNWTPRISFKKGLADLMAQQTQHVPAS